MSFAEILSLVTCACAIVAAGCAVAVARRAQRWRDTDEAVALLGRIDEVEDRMTQVEGQTKNLATKEDLAAARGEIHAVATTVNTQVVPGLSRIEGYFLQEGVRASR